MQPINVDLLQLMESIGVEMKRSDVIITATDQEQCLNIQNSAIGLGRVTSLPTI